MRRISTFFHQKLHYVVFVFLFALGLFGFYAANSQTIFNSPGTYTFRVNSQSNGVVIEVWGAGGSGGNGSATGGGGGGGYSRTTVNLAPGDYTVIVGSGGTFNGITNGGGSSFKSGNTIIDSASGGTGGGASTGGVGGGGIAVGGNGISTAFHTGGTGGTANTQAGGGGGGSALTGANGTNGGNASNTTGGTGGAGQGAGGNGGNKSASGVNGNSPGGAGGGNGNGGANAGNGAAGQVVINGAAGIILPVKFSTLDARTTNSSVSLKWNVATEDDVNGYEIERSADGRSYSKIGFVGATGASNYSFLDTKALSIAYYRIKSVDISGRYGYSSVALVKAGKAMIVIKAFPTPFIKNVSIQHPTADAGSVITISSQDGRIIKSIIPAAGTQQTDVDLSSANAGLYLVRYKNGNGEVETLKIIKQ